MRKYLQFSILTLFVLVVLGCATYTATTQATPPVSPLEQAKRAYVAGSLDYDFSLKVVTEARAAHLVNNAQWSRIEQAVKVAQEWAPLVDAMFVAWETYGQKPANFDAARGKLNTAFSEVTTIRREVQP